MTHKKKTHKHNFATRTVPGQSRKFVYVYVFFSLILILLKVPFIATVPLMALVVETCADLLRNRQTIILWACLQSTCKDELHWDFGWETDGLMGSFVQK